MSREILFKAMKINDLEWVEGDLNHSFKTFISTEGGQYHQVYPFSVSQYTGVNDGDGKKIFENDIVYYDNAAYKEAYRGQVNFGEYMDMSSDEATHVGFYIDWICKPGYLRKDLGFWKDKIRIIGTAFDDLRLKYKASYADQDGLAPAT